MIPLLLLVLNLSAIAETPCVTHPDGSVVCIAEIRNPKAPFGKASACFDEDGYLVPCEEVKSHLAEYAVNALLGRGVDVFTGAVAFSNGAVEANKIQPTPEHRAGVSLLLVGGQIGISTAIEKKWGYKKARLFSRASMVVQFVVGGSNLFQAWKAQHQDRKGP